MGWLGRQPPMGLHIIILYSPSWSVHPDAILAQACVPPSAPGALPPWQMDWTREGDSPRASRRLPDAYGLPGAGVTPPGEAPPPSWLPAGGEVEACAREAPHSAAGPAPQVTPGGLAPRRLQGLRPLGVPGVSGRFWSSGPAGCNRSAPTGTPLGGHPQFCRKK